MTEGGANGTKGGASVAPSLQFPRWVWLSIAAALGVNAVILATTRWMDEGREGDSVLLPAAIDEATSLALNLPLIYLIVRWTAFVWPSRIGWPLTIAGHVAGALCYFAAHVGGMSGLRYLVYPLFGYVYEFGPLFFGLVYEFRKDVFSYALIVAAIIVIARALDAFSGEPSAPRSRLASADPLPTRLEIRDGARTVWVEVKDILFAEAAGNYVEIHTSTQSHLRRGTLAATAEELPGFIRIHRSRIVNAERIRSVASKETGDFEVTLDNGAVIAGSRRWRSEVPGLRKERGEAS
ncbi:MAG: LytTR family transcriptional regulator [Alphaproteobacteria bacterium]|nr:LytTR family transcriptional regulator [Alphaproteobacteria bacterium]